MHNSQYAKLHRLSLLLKLYITYDIYYMRRLSFTQCRGMHELIHEQRTSMHSIHSRQGG